MRPLQICLDTNIWLDTIERKGGDTEKSKKLFEMVTDIKSPHKIVLPIVAYLEIIHKLIDIRKEKYLISKGYSSLDIKSLNGKDMKFKVELPKKEMKKIERKLLNLKNSNKIEIISTSLDFNKIEMLVKQGFELLDSMIIMQAVDGKADYLVTRDRIVRKINESKMDWIKLKTITTKGMISLLERN